MPNMQNVIDQFKGLTPQEVRSRLVHRNFSVLIANLEHDLNIGTVIRNANAFGAKEVFVYGRKRWDRRGAVGSHHYTDVRYIQSNLDLVPTDYHWIGVDNLPGAKPIERYGWPVGHLLLCFGQESYGLPKEVIDRCSEMVYIEQYGSVRSLNVGCASAVTMFAASVR